VNGGTYRLVLLRHGESEWNARNVFTGWADPALTTAGEQQATEAGRLLAERRLQPDVVHTSLQRRTIKSASLALAAAGRDWIPVRRSWRLNGRHYGALQGRNKAQARAEYGERQVELWRRSYDEPPPPASQAVQQVLFGDPRYANLPPRARPAAESLRDVAARLLPYWYDAIIPDLMAGGMVLVVSHGNTLRALVKHLDGISDEDVPALEVPHGTPLIYELTPDLVPLARELTGSFTIS
jgi:2,3-bisphosphoglycerate-dependent phosphoglycerate mutase